MSNSITGQPDSTGVAEAIADAARDTGADSAQHGQEPVAGDKNNNIKMKLPSLNRHVEELTTSIKRGAVVDKEKVKALKAAISNGTYHIDAESIAEKVLELEPNLKDKLKGS